MKKWLLSFLDRFLEKSWQRKANKMFSQAHKKRNLK